MQIVSALFVENFDMRQAEGGAARIDLTGVHFSLNAPGPLPVTIEPHLVVLVRCPADHGGMAALETVFTRDGEQVARNVQPLQIEPGRFGYRLVKAELTFEEPGMVEAACRIDGGDPLVVPLTLIESS